ncbi:helix-turn-helix domain-containing protein [Pedobacter sp. MC2016-05]|uniref:helix-turn-helix domain-containing protein n=1 Tax=Pedobacter sp. MC2016-05 TaxID=2994474 RepID=UPI00224800FB|nr:helix-turn-helix domain-containing protein [Pedobacter sp. MC2016-05]MCX2477169.1 helix-turn-helix domain-containing protein [Pedobacter sp. MC2016-05]
MNKIDALLDILSKIYQILVLVYNSKYHGNLAFDEDPQMNRQEVMDYLGISESTYKRMVRQGRLKPMKLPGGDKFYKSDLLSEFKESKRRGRV